MKKSNKLITKIKELENTNHWYKLAIDLLSKMDLVFKDEEACRDTHYIFDTAHHYITRLFDFDITAFYMVQRSTAHFILYECEPSNEEDKIQNFINNLIANKKLKPFLNNMGFLSFPYHESSTLIIYSLSSKVDLCGVFVGVIQNTSSSYNDEHLNLLVIFLQKIGYALESTALSKLIQEQDSNLKEALVHNHELEHQSRHDYLTGLPNRFVFIEKIRQAIEHAQLTKLQVVVMILDLDMFKIINDTLGYKIGDQLLLKVTERLQKQILVYNSFSGISHSNYMQTQNYSNKKFDFLLSRLSGDEFAILMTDVLYMDDILSIAQHIIDVISVPYTINKKQIFITASLGISLHPSDSSNPYTLLEYADSAMHHAKKQGRDAYYFYSKEINKHALKYFRLGSGLRQALDKNEFILHYQPQIDLKSGRVIAVEALIRWNHPSMGLIAPNDFIPIAEESGIIIPIGEWLLETACKQTKLFDKAGFTDLRIAINMSAKQFNDGDLLATINSILNKYEVKAHKLELELTEGVIMQNINQTIDVLKQLKAQGFSIAIDDFGMGYSSLAYLKQFPVNFLKIDQSFIREIADDRDDTAIVRAIITLAHNLGLTVIAEGVETKDQVAFLKALGCDLAQGYFYSKPLPEAELHSFLYDQGLNLLS